MGGPSRGLRVLMSADTVGGVFHYAVELARALCLRGAKVALATMGAPLSADQRLTLHDIHGLSVFESEFALEWMPEPWQSVDEAGRWLLRIAERFSPDVVHLNGYCHASLPWRAKVLLVAHSCVVSWSRAVRGTDPPPSFDRYRARVRAGLAHADLVVAPSATMLADLRAAYAFAGEARVIYNGIAWRARAKGAKQPFYLSAGRLWDEAKNLQLIAQVASELPWPVRVAGDCPDAAHAPALDWLGKLPRAQLLSLMAASSIFLHPARYEPFGLAPLEAALSGAALVLGDIPSLREIWCTNACYVPPSEPATLLAIARELARDDARRLELAERARRHARRYSAELMGREYLASYRELLGETTAELALESPAPVLEAS